MIHRRIIYWLLLLTVWTSAVLAQMISEPITSPVTRYTGLSYNAGSNPAYLIFDYNGPSVTYRVDYLQTEGDFRRAFDPGRRADNYWTAAGRKALGERQVFSGSFSYHNQSLDEKMWVHTRQPYIGIPFLLADSSVGGFNLNGICWQMDYGVELIPEKLAGGLSIFYNVDESYKTVFPKPKNNTRDLYVTLGTGVNWRKNYRFGFSTSYFSFQEINATSKYSADQDMTPIFYKIRGFDNSLSFYGETSEERLTEIEGFTIDLDLVRVAGAGYSGLISGGVEVAQAHLQDGGSYPVEQGWWWSNRYYFSNDLKIKVTDQLFTGLALHGELNTQTADHPDLEIKVYESRFELLGGSWKLGYSILNTSYHFAINGYSQSLTQTDLYNGLLLYFPINGVGMELGLQHRLLDKLQIDLLAETLFNKSGAGEVFADYTNSYFKEVTTTEIDYYGSDWLAGKFEACLSWYGNNLVKYTLAGRYTNKILKTANGEDSYINTANRKTFNISLIIERLNK